MTCELGFVYFLSDLVVWSVNPGAQNNPNLFPKCLSVLLPRLEIGQSDKRQAGKRKHMCAQEYVCGAASQIPLGAKFSFTTKAN